jgi:hypothetical protein
VIKNYTSSVPANRSMMHIEEQLIKHGANEILKWYDDSTRKILGLAFIVKSGNNTVPFRLPVNVDNVEKYLIKELRPTSPTAKEKISAQAERTAWKLLSDAIDIQMAQIDLDQTKLSQAFMGYVYDHTKKETMFDKWEKNNFAQLEYKKS